MKNPFRTEAEAFKLVWLTIVYFALIVIASVINTWLGVGVFIGETAIVLWWFLTRGQREEPIPQSPPPHPSGEWRILVIANETVGGTELLSELRRRAAGEKEVKVAVVCPALNSPLRHWVSDEDGARAKAQTRIDESLASMRAAGIEATGQIGDADPLLAIDDGLRTFGPDEIVISTHPEGRSNWLERGVVEKARERVTVPVTHVVVDLEAESEAPAAGATAGDA